MRQAIAKHHKILVMGLPGAGKTTLSRLLAPRLGAVWFNADAVRSNLWRDLGFSLEDRIEHARRMGWMCDRVVEAGGVAIADFICPTVQTRAAFGEAFTIWVDRIATGRFDDTNKLFTPPSQFALRLHSKESPELWVEKALACLRPRPILVKSRAPRRRKNFEPGENVKVTKSMLDLR